ncbi:glycoside hydrolase family 92 protein [Prolixibacteraceae bacterium JC049]|nr:glycoside hydrolase family 92 protein [Prolixibacteraceae bacterium JC049]
MNRLQTITWSLLIILFAGCQATLPKTDLVQYVNPLIGTAPSTTISALEHGHGKENNAQVVPFVTVPFGMTNWTPQTKAYETKCHAPYYYTDLIIQGFRGSHWLSGSCVQDYGSMTLMPISGHLQCLPTQRGSKYSHDKEKATPYEYQVHLTDYNIDVNMTATKRAGWFQMVYNNAGEAHLVVNPNSDEGQGFVKVLPEQNEIIGYNPAHRIYQGWGEPTGFSGYFVVRFHKKIKSYGVYQGNKIFEGDDQVADAVDLGAYISFMVEKDETVEVTVGTSFTSIEQARKNLDAETNGLSYNEVKANLKHNWEQLLGKVKVETTSHEDKVKFYTALYHSFLQPRTFNDVDGSYVAFADGKKVLNSGDKDYFVDFSMWDTYRASHPLFNLLMPKANADMMNSLFLKAEQGGWLPIFPCWNSYTSAMIGDHVIATIADAYMKDIIDLTDEQYQYLLKNAFESPATYEEYKSGKGRRALKSYIKYGYIPLEDEVKESYHSNEQVSRTLEYAFNDFALYQVALKRGDTKNAAILKQRAKNYRNVYSKADSCVRGRFKDGRFTDDFDKFTRKSYITEGTPYQYTWYVPHDVAGLIDLMGGDDGFNANLDRFYAAGQYWHGNEPGHQTPFLFNYSGQAWKTQAWVNEILKKEYGVGPGGLSGNDDAGQMSAWYVFGAMGFYPVCPSVPEYAISGPHFDRLTIQLENGKKLEIIAKGASSGKNFIQSLKVNGKLTDRNYLKHSDFINGGIFEFEMGEFPNKHWGERLEARPSSMD